MTTPTSTSCTVRYYANASGASGPEKITLDIYQGGASVTAGAQISGNITRGSYNSYTATLNVTGATDWGALQVALAANNVAGSEYVMVSRLEVECPDPPTANNPPVINTAASTTATEDTLYSYDAAIQTPDDGPSEIWSLGAANTCSGSSITAVTGIYTFTPAGPVPPASCLLDIQVCDGATPEQCDTETVTINITAVNDPPAITSSAGTAATEDILYSYTATATDADGPAPLAWSVLGTDTCGGAFAGNVYSFTPAGPTPPASCNLAVQVCDNNGAGLCTPETATITITAVNDPPTITSSAATAATEDTLYSYTATATDGDGPGTTWFVLGTDTCGGAFAGNVYSFTPAGPSPPANCDVSIQVCDGGTPDQCATQTTTITIAAINDPPAGGADSYSTAKNTPLSVSAPGVLNNDSDPEGGGLTAQNATGTDVGGATVSLNANGSFTYTPKNNYTGADGFSYDVCDVGPLCVTVRVDITVTAGGDTTPPTVTSTTPVSGATDVALDSQVTINFSENIDCTTVNTTNITNTSPGWTLFSCSGSQAIFNTSGQANSTTYSVNVTTSVTDLAANPMSAPYPFSYTTSSGADATKPKVISFTATTPVTTSVNIPVTVFTATDNVGVTGYMITQNSTPPNSGDASWTGTPPATYSATAGDGTKTLYPWVKDAADNVSDAFAAPASVVVDGTGPTDGTLTVTAGDTLNSLSWTAANDGAGVGLRATGRYTVRFAEGAAAPADCAAGTSLYTGNNLTFAHAGLTNTTQYSYRVCAYDALANISTGATGSGTPMAANTPTLSDTTVKWATANKVSSAKTTTATLGATLNASGTSAITGRGVVWSASNTNPTIGGADVTTVAGSGTAPGAFTVSVTGLPPASQIYFQGYAANGSGTSYSGVNSFWTEPDTATAPTVNAIIPGENYFDLTVNYDAKPVNADGMLVVVRQSYVPNAPPFDGTVYTANTRIGSGSATDPNCLFYCEYVVADITAATPGSVKVTGLKAGINHYFALYSYKGSGSGLSGINYVQTINAAMQATASVPLAGRSHNEVWVAGSSPKDGVNWGTMTSTDCANCHNSHHTSQLLPTGVDMYDKCYTCHQDGGAADDNTADAKINMALHLSDGSVDCGTCHSMHSFRTEELFSEDNQGNKGFNIAFVRANMAKYFNTGNGFATNALEPTVFQNRPTDFANAAADAPYNAVCQTCHTDVARTPHHQQVATDEHQTGMDCMTCHTHRNASGKMDAFAPGGHDATHFPWDATTQASCGTAGCHDFAANPDVVGDVHGGVCSVCHSNASGGDGTAKVGDATFGIDGDATLGSTATPHTDNCLVCHPAATYDRSTVHHASKNGYAAAGSCTQCHTGSNYPGDHSARVSLATNCADCHTGTQGVAGGIPVDPTDATVAERKVHDACTTCHNTNGDATLRLPYGVAQAMPDGGAGSGNGGGSCESCHTSGFGGYHATVGHATTVNTYVNCATCHTGTAGTASDIPTSAADNKVHDACTTCHGADGRLINSAATHNGGTEGGSDAVNNCATCHGEYFSSHTNIDHTAYVAAGGLICTDCHTATAGTTTTVPVDPANNKKHDACSTCHQATGVLKTFALADTHNPDWIAAMPAGGGNCTACHGAAFFTSGHSATHDAKFYYDTTGTGADVDILQNNGSAGCASCHNDAGASLATFTAISQEHLNDCNKCHTETRDINESAATGTTVRQWIAARAAETTIDTNCRTCHVPNWNNVPNHAAIDHVAMGKATFVAQCAGCHDQGNAGDDAKMMAIHNASGAGCGTCHVNPAGSGALVDKSGGGTYASQSKNYETVNPTGGSCITCHDAYGSNFQAGHWAEDHRNMANTADMLTTTASCTANCHTAATAATIVSGTHKDTCTSCHTNMTTDGRLRSGTNGSAANHTINTASTCATCHGATGGFNYDSQFQTAHKVQDHTGITYTAAVDTGIQSNDCQDCHAQTTAATIISTTHNNCTDCHNNTTTDGRLIAGNTAASYNGTTSVGDATVHTLGGTSECITCHAAAYFSNTNSPKHSNGTSNGGVHRVAIDGDTSSGTTCSAAGCHQNQSENWTNILNRHDLSATDTDVCHVCHDSTRTTNTVAGSVQLEITTNAGRTTITSCLECHSDKSVSHGGHDDPDTKVLRDAECTSTCHSYATTGVHNTTTPVTTIHGDNCGWCHAAAGGGGPLIPSLIPLGEGPQGCIDCHGFSANTEAAKITGHHNYTTIAAGSNGRALSGDCVACHIANVNQDGTLDMPTNLPCNFCHLYFPEGAGYQKTGGKNNVYALTWTPAAGGGTLGSTVLTSHTISVTAAPPINNYQACFACHGASLYSTATKVTPFHGYGTVYMGEDVNGGDANDIINVYMNPQHSGAGSWAAKNVAIHPGAINFNSIGSNVMGAKATKPYANDSNNFHKNDLGNHTRAQGLIQAGNFTVPWDNFATGVGSGTITITHRFSNEAKSPAITTYNTPVTPTIPLVPLTYP